jgi:hypothetical protein
MTHPARGEDPDIDRVSVVFIETSKGTVTSMEESERVDFITKQRGRNRR